MKYAKYLPEKMRRETWDEIVTRNMMMHIKRYPHLAVEIKNAYKLVYDRKVLPSMRSMQFAGKPIEINPARIYNCSFLPMDDALSFAELMFLLLSGVGVGYSVQRHHIDKLPEIRKPHKTRRYLVNDSIEGWADAVKMLIRAYLTGKSLPIFDLSDIRPKGAALITAGGKAPGPEPLRECLDKIKRILDRKEDGEKLTPLEVHDINCIIADAVLAGGIRRSAMIALFDLNEEEMLNCKSNIPLKIVGDVTWQTFGNKFTNEEQRQATFYVEYLGERIPLTLTEFEFNAFQESGKLAWYNVAPHRGRANNSVVLLRHKITKDVFLKLWEVIESSGAGEPGFFFSNDRNMGLNPCAEISLQPYQFCNLVTINASDLESQEDYEERVRAATLIATIQASYTNFHYLRDIWKRTTEKEALIGVSMTGIASGKVLQLDEAAAAKVVLEENARVAGLLGVKPAARATTVKPEGTSSLVLGSSSGIHAWHSEYYFRRVRVGKNEPIYAYLSVNHPELLEDDYFRPDAQAIIRVPVKAPDGAITRTESALDLLARVGHVWNNWVKAGHRKGDNINN
ncbi:MAG: hypothetical protein KY428_04350, partial [Bacteroidetes bacterium]|nr:hypothetical protein [Bacteroidota bacterium]